MKRFFCCLLIAACLLSSVCACAAANDLKILHELMELAQGGMGLQKWLDQSVATAAGSTADNYILNLNRSAHDLYLSAYADAAAGQLVGNAISNPVSRQRCALALLSCDAHDRLPEGLADETIGKLGVMSYVYGLHLLNNGADSAQWSCESVIEKILSFQKADGGWAVMGNFGDPDVTAMCLQALACVRKIEGVEPAIERALVFLSEKQLDNGGYRSSGNENSESAAQVILTLASLGIDPRTDERFIKNGTSVFDALMSYRMEDGGFAHLAGDAVSNETASLQAAQAFVALQEFGQPYFDFNKLDFSRNLSDRKSLVDALGWKLWGYIAVAALALIGTIFSLTRRHGRKKQLIFVLLICLIAVGVISWLDIESASDYYSVPQRRGTVVGSVTMSIRCDKVAGLAKDGSTPEDGCILPETQMVLYEGDSAFDLLTDAVREHKLHMEYKGGTEGLAYVCAINHLYEYTHGELSGWIYHVNGISPSVGCGNYQLADGDEIIWHYTTQLGEDLK